MVSLFRISSRNSKDRSQRSFDPYVSKGSLTSLLKCILRYIFLELLDCALRYRNILKISSFDVYGYVVVQFHPWFNFYFPLFIGMIMYDYNELKTKEIKIKPRIKLNHNGNIKYLFLTVFFFICIIFFQGIFLFLSGEDMYSVTMCVVLSRPSL